MGRQYAETHDEFRKRLEDEGRFREFLETKKRLDAQYGTSPGQKKKNWNAAAKLFGYDPGTNPVKMKADPPPKTVKPPEGTASPSPPKDREPVRPWDELETAFTRTDNADSVSAIDWVAANLGVKNPDIDTCPSSTAWNLMTFARTPEYKPKFWDIWWRHKQNASVEGSETYIDDARQHFAVIERLRRAHAED